MLTGVDGDLVHVSVNGSTQEVQTTVVSERSPLSVNYHLHNYRYTLTQFIARNFFL